MAVHGQLWKGFESLPEGCILEQYVDLSGACGLAYERSCSFYKDFHVHDRLMLVCPFGSSEMKIRTQRPKCSFQVDAKSVLLIPAGLLHDDESVSNMYHTMALFPSVDLVQEVCGELKVGQTGVETLLTKCHEIQRTSWLDHLLQEYLFERVGPRTAVDKKAKDDEFRFFERKILLEVIRNVFHLPKKLHQKIHRRWMDPVALKALEYLESNLFEDLNLQMLSREAGASPSTLLRSFKKHMGQTPFQYLQMRRLDEAHRILKMGTHSVSEVAILVGYKNFGAFTDAFQKKFGLTPSVLRKTRSKRLEEGKLQLEL
jgi:AraC-like DNA-binding protein